MAKKQNTQNELNTPIAIVGMGAVFPDARDMDEYWENVRSGKDCIKPIPVTHWNPNDYFDSDKSAPDMTYAKMGGFLPQIDFEPLKYGIPPNQIEATDTSQILGMVTAQMALENAGYGPDNKDFDRDRTSCIMGITGALELVVPLGARLGHPAWKKALKDAGVDDETTADVMNRISNSYVGWQEASFPGLLGNVVAGRIAHNLDLGGTNSVVDAACGSSLAALNLAILELQNGKCDMAITGGADTFNDIFMYMCFSKTPALSPSGHSKPFSNDGDGTALGEGIGVLILKRLEDAEKDGDRIYSVIKGLGTSSDGHGQAIYAPAARGQVKALKRAYASAGVDPKSVALVEGHGTGTKVGDATEVKALREVYGATATPGPWCAIGSVKSQIGHAKAAAGAAGIIKTALALHHKVLPPTIKVSTENEALKDGPFYINSKQQPWFKTDGEPRRAGVSAFGFGGSNYHCVLEEYSASKEETVWGNGTEILPISSDSLDKIKATASSLAGLSWDDLRQEALSLKETYSSNDPFRLVAVISKADLDTLQNSPEWVAALGSMDDGTSGKIADGVFVGRGSIAAKTAFVYPGQGAQYPGMLKDLYLTFPEMMNSLNEATNVAGGNGFGNNDFLNILYPRSFEEENKEALAQTDRAQPSIGINSLGLTKILRAFGVEPDGAAGHSYGEIPALYAAGRLSEEEMLIASFSRGQAMANAAGEDAGTMVAAIGERERVEQIIRDEKINVSLANHNSARQMVLSGSREEIIKATKILKANKIKAIPLTVGAAFHSPIVAGATKEFERTVKKFKFPKAKIPVFANTTSETYPDAANKAKELLTNQLAKPVEFVSMIQNMIKSGINLFVEVGPSNVLSKLVGEISKGIQETRVISLDNPKSKLTSLELLAHSLAELGALGLPVKFNLWNPAKLRPKADGKKTFAVKVCGANHYTPQNIPARKPKEIRGLAMNREAPRSEPMSAMQAQPKKQSIPTPKNPASAVVKPQMATNPIRTRNMNDNSNSNGGYKSSDEYLRLSQESLLAIQKIQQQNAELHRKFLENQAQSQEMFFNILARQMQVTEGTSVALPQTVVTESTPAPAPVITQPTPTPRPEPVYEAPVQQPVQATPAPVVRETVVPPAPVIQTPAVTAPIPADVNTGFESMLLAVVSEKTGYPLEMLETGMSLEADLGIDSIKRVEILSALSSENDSIPEIEPDLMGSIETVQDILNLLDEKSGGTSSAIVPPVPAPSQPTANSQGNEEIKSAMLSLVAEQTGYPKEMLGLEMELEADLGIDSIKRVEILSGLSEVIPAADDLEVSELNDVKTLNDIYSRLTLHTSGQAAPNATPTSAPLGETLEGDKTLIIEVISEKTGYPVDMLEDHMELEQDLGVDSIKRVEIFSAIQDQVPSAKMLSTEELNSVVKISDIFGMLGTGLSGTEKKKTTVSHSALM